MPGDLYDTVFAQMFSLGVRKLVLTGGEPLLLAGLEEIIRTAYTNGLHTSVVTNGLRLTERRLTSLIEAGLLGITISLDSLDADRYRELRGTSFDEVSNALALLSREAQDDRLAVSINCVLTSLNYEDVPRLVHYAAEHGMSIMIQPCNPCPGMEVNTLLPDARQISSVRTIVESLVSMKEQGAPILNSPSFLRRITQYWALGGMPPTSRCYYGYVNVTIRHNGDVVPCWRLPKVGNIYTDSLISIWSHKMFARRRRQMTAGHCPGCWLSCNIDWQVVWHTREEVDSFWREHFSS